ncbi:peptidoglycan DD-metalloendopeptidase family protein [Luteipulveratus halotolerans]|uniref:peptidoglycan DD-metalloendopeptidase family protein n=1 Tax=Luteipulveratus halotolerans TaxID=1631356 RepID=UPI00067FBE35|nr:peptidoglycan DD-metalloendopeptidase family protein [Luteipulveratus halotolerans]
MKAVVAVVGGLVVLPVLLVAVLFGGAVGPQQELLSGAGAGVGAGVGGALRAGSVPKELVPAINKAASMCPEISPALIAAQIENESQFRNVRSPAGAQGYSQFMPGTWAAVGKDYSGDGVADVHNPLDSIPSQGDYLCQVIGMVKRWKAQGVVTGDVVRHGLTGYNGGPGVVRRYNGPIPGDRESMNYARNILARVPHFAAELANPGGGAGAVSGHFANPLGTQAYRITSRPGKRGAPCAGCSTDHKGLDMALPIGSTVFSGCDGRVLRVSGHLGGLGKGTIVDCGGGIRTYYGHQSVQSVTAGQSVKAGQPIGKSGNTGNSSGPHLHFELHSGAGESYFSGDVEDPVAWMATKGVKL